MDYIELFKKVIKVPESPCNNGNKADWEEFENKEIQIFPDDYKAFINTYGSGVINNFIWILNPFEKNENINFFKKSKEMLDAYSELKQMFPNDYVYDVYPQSKGLLPCGVTDNGDEIYWKTDQHINDWKIIVYDSSAESYEYDMSLIEFLYKICIKEIMCEAFPDDLFDKEAKFTKFE